jgi:arginine deiminase
MHRLVKKALHSLNWMAAHILFSWYHLTARSDVQGPQYVQKQVLREMSTEQLIDSIMIHPTVTLSPSFRDTGLTSTYSFQPLANLVYMRDQQITTCKGIVLGRLRSEQRQLEVELMNFAFNKLGAPPRLLRCAVC